MRLVERLDQIGTTYAANPTQRRYIQIVNRVSILFALLVLLIGIVAYAYFGWFASTRLALSLAGIFYSSRLIL